LRQGSCSCSLLSSELGSTFCSFLDLVSKLASRKIGIRQPEAVQALSTMTGSSTLLAFFRGGVSGAEHWSGHRYVPQEHSLYSTVTSNAFI
jgi:hypothetical protein